MVSSRLQSHLKNCPRALSAVSSCSLSFNTFRLTLCAYVILVFLRFQPNLLLLRHQPWIIDQIKCLTHKKQHAYNHTCAINTDWAKYKDIKRQCQYKFRKCFNQYVFTLIDPNSNVITRWLWSKQEAI